MAVIVYPFILTNGTVADANEVMADFNAITAQANGSLGPTNIDLTASYAWTGNHTFSQNLVWYSGTAFTGTLDHANTANRVYTFPDASGTVLLNSSTGSGGTVPIGSIIPFYDFNALATFDTTNWKYCDGSVVGGAGPLAAQTLPDLSGRYLVGFGTDGGGDIDTAAWATAAVGNASHEINIAHTHTGPSHTHDMGNHTHNIPAHFHGTGTLAIAAGGSHTHTWSSTTNPGASGIPNINPNPNGDAATDVFANANTASTHSHPNGDFSGSVGNTGGSNGDAAFASTTPSTNTTSASGTGATGSSLSATQSIQPRSIRVRYIMRVL